MAHAPRFRRARIVFASALLVIGLAPASVAANGSYTHVHISQIAYQSLPDGEVKALLDDPQNQRICEAGSMFPDSGYAAEAEYGEYAHWAPFFDDYIDWLRATYGTDFSSAEAQAQIAFLLGATSHGLADQTYDPTILEREFEIDGPEMGGISADQYADYFIVVDHDVVLDVDPTVAPYAILPEILNMGLMAPTDASELMRGMNIMDGVIDNQGHLLARIGYDQAWETFPWLGTHIYNPKARGSLPWLGDMVSAYWQVLLRRIQGTDDIDQDLVIRTIPPDGAKNFAVSLEEDGVYARMGLVFGYGIVRDEVTPHITLKDGNGDPVPLDFGSPYNSADAQFVFFTSQAPLEYHTTYTVELSPGITPMHGGATTTQTFSYSFETRCDGAHLYQCEPLEPLLTGSKPTREPPQPGDDTNADAGRTTDAGVEPGPDGGTVDPPSSGGCAIGGAADGAHSLAGALALAFVLAYRRRRGLA